MIDIILLSIAAAILLIASWTDLKTREVPDWVNYAGVVLGLGLRLLFSSFTNDWTIILEGVIGFGIFFLLAVAMFYMGQWGGGDSKMLMGLGALLGIQWNPNHVLIAFFVNMLFVGAAYGLLWSIVLAIKNWKAVIKEAKSKMVGRSYKMKRNALYVLILIAVIISFFTSFEISAIILSTSVIFVFLFYASAILIAIEKVSFIKTVPISKLTEGDWIVNDVKVNGKYICGPKDLGVSKEQIATLKKLKKQKKIKNIVIKEGMPFIPVFLISFALAITVGNIVLIFI